MNELRPPVYAYGHPTNPLIVASLERARARAVEEATNRGQTQSVMRLDLNAGDHTPEIIGEASPDGSYRTPGNPHTRRPSNHNLTSKTGQV